jgi:putative N-acetyltransferase (TIGR04045 family)
MMFEPFPRFIASAFQVKFATHSWERNDAHALRRAVFCQEQGLFGDDDRDAIDDRAIPIVAISMLGVAADAVVGTVRIDEREPGVWWGSRLAVTADYRRVGMLGSLLIRLAVSSANARGCRHFFAYVQSQNVVLFRRMHWRTIEEVVLHGKPHHRMEADLAFYPSFADAEVGFHSLSRRAA